MDLLRTENVHAAFYDADADRVITIPRPADATERLIDGKPSVAVARDNQSAAIAWSALEADSSYVDVYIRRIVRDGSTWRFEDAVRFLRLPGIDRDVSVTAVRDGSYLVTWINEDVQTKTSRLFSGRLRADGVIETQLLALASEGTQISDVEMVSNGEKAFMVYARSYQTEESEFMRSIEVFRYRNGTWSVPRTIEIGSDLGVCRHIDADLNSDGNFIAIIDAVDYKTQGSAERVVSAVAGSIDDQPSAWTIYRNHPSFTEANRATWHLSTAIGPNNTFYIASQELDTLRDNRQSYRNGLQIGPSRCNAVIRALRINQEGDLTSVPFGNAPVSVDESSSEQLERTLRYRVKVMEPAPNPVREACVVPLAVQRATTIDVKLYDAVGSYVATLYTGDVAEGIQGVSFTVQDLATGHYTVVVADAAGIAGSVPVVVIR
jgi:hypothetical protein